MAIEFDKYKLSQKWFANDYTSMLVSLLPEGLVWIFDRFVTGYVIQDAYGDQDTSWQDTFTSLEEMQDTPLEEGASGNVLRRILSCFASEFERAESSMWALLNQTDPGVSIELLEDHEYQLGLPEECLADTVMTLDERQRQAHTKLFKQGVTTNFDFYYDMAEDLGFDITIVEGGLVATTPRRMGVARMGVERMGGAGGNSVLQITINSGTSDNELLKCVFNQIVQAHVVIDWIE